MLTIRSILCSMYSHTKRKKNMAHGWFSKNVTSLHYRNTVLFQSISTSYLCDFILPNSWSRNHLGTSFSQRLNVNILLHECSSAWEYVWGKAHRAKAAVKKIEFLLTWHSDTEASDCLFTPKQILELSPYRKGNPMLNQHDVFTYGQSPF